MTDFLVLENSYAAIRPGVITELPAGMIINDDQWDVVLLQSQGVSAAVYNPANMAAPLAAFKRQKGKPGQDADLIALLLAAGAIGGGGGSVFSVFTRVGAVVAMLGDYSSGLITNASGVAGATVTAALDALATAIGALVASAIGNDSAVAGTTVADALVNAQVTGLVTGLLTGGLMTAGAGAGEINIAAGSACFIDDTTDPAVPVLTSVTWTAFTNVAITDILTSDFTGIGINDSGAVVQVADRVFTGAEHRTIAILGQVSHPDHVNIPVGSIVNLPAPVNQAALATVDIMQALGTLNFKGNVFSANGVNLSLDVSSGLVLRGGSNFHTDTQDPNILTQAGEAPVSSAVFVHRDGSGGFTTGVLTGAFVDPGFYDTGTGTLVAVSPGGRFTIQPLYLGFSGIGIAQYGQALYNSLDLAQEALTDAVISNPDLDDVNFRGWLIVRGNATDLSDTAQARFVVAPKFAGGGTGAAGVITVHGDLSSLLVDDHTQYSLADGSRGVALDGTFRVQDTGDITRQFAFDLANILTGNTRTFTVPDANLDLSALNSTFLGTVIRTAAGVYGMQKHNLVATTDPGVGDDGLDDYAVGSIWANVTLDTLWFCLDSTTGAAVWLQLGAGGGAQTIQHTRSNSASDYYESASGVCPGADDFIVSFMFRAPGPEAISSFRELVNNKNGGTDGWAILFTSSALRFEVIDGSGNELAGNPGYWLMSNDYEIGRDVHVLLRAYQSGGVLNVMFYWNGFLAETGVGIASGMTPGAGTMNVGGAAQDAMFAGVLYYEGTLTDAQIDEHIQACMLAGDVVALPSAIAADNRWSVAGQGGSPGATWSPEEGSDDLTENGTMVDEEVVQNYA